MYLAEKLKQAMFEAKLTQEQLAKKMNVTQAAISQFFNKKNGLNVKTLEKFAKATKKDVSWFLEEGIKDVAINTGDNNARISTDARISELEKENAYLKGKLDILEKLLQKDK